MYRASYGFLEDLPGDEYILNVLTDTDEIIYSTDFSPSYPSLTDPPQISDTAIIDVSVPVLDNIDHFSLSKDGNELMSFKIETNCSDGIDNDGEINCDDCDCYLNSRDAVMRVFLTK